MTPALRGFLRTTALAALLAVAAPMVVAADESSPAVACAAAADATAKASCEHAINTKGTGSSGRAASPAQPGACEHAINSKGTGVAGRVQSPTAADAHDGHTASAPDHSCRMGINEQGVPDKKDKKKK